jgi:2-amino-4-hydroxy-6-hydroxymethyldihydropteridine diphosphokinase
MPKKGQPPSAKLRTGFDKLRVSGVCLNHWYLIGIGSNRIHAKQRVAAALPKAVAHSPIIASRPIGPGMRTYANAVVMIKSKDHPDALLKKLKKIERSAGRRPGRRWGDRPLDLDIIAWSGGIWASPGLTIPHTEFRKRRFVLAPLCEIAPDWRDPVTHLTARQLLARLDRKRRCA